MFSLPEFSETGLTVFRVMLLLAGVSAAVMLLAQGKVLFSKGENGWKILIPVYGQYRFYSLTCETGGVYMEAVVCMVLAALLYLISPAFGLFFLLTPAVCLLICSIWLANAYGKNVFFGLGLFLLPAVFYPILAYGYNRDATTEAA